ncbi:hypothetical protein D3C75_864830 [compost metagenome]
MSYPPYISKTLLLWHFFFKFSDLVPQLGCGLKLLLRDTLLEFLLQFIDLAFAHDLCTGAFRKLANMSGAAMHPPEERV